MRIFGSCINEKSSRAKRKRFPALVLRDDVHLAGPFYIRVDLWKTEATLRALHRFSHWFHYWIDEDQRHERGDIGFVSLQPKLGGAVLDSANVDDRELESLSDLLCCKPDATRGIHGRKHVRDQLLDFGRNCFNSGSFLAEHRVAVFDDRQDHNGI